MGSYQRNIKIKRITPERAEESDNDIAFVLAVRAFVLLETEISKPLCPYGFNCIHDRSHWILAFAGIADGLWASNGYEYEGTPSP